MKALAGIRVVDFSWVQAGPWATRWLGAFGAEIVKIEWPENERGRLPSTTTPQHLEVNLNTSGNFNDTNVTGQPPAGWGWSYMDDTGGMYGAMCAMTGLYTAT